MKASRNQLAPQYHQHSAESTVLDYHADYEKKKTATAEIRLNPLPAAHLITLPNPTLLPINKNNSDNRNTCQSTVLTLVYPRLQKPVPPFDSSTGDYVTGQPTFFTVLSTTDYSKQQEKHRNIITKSLIFRYNHNNNPNTSTLTANRNNDWIIDAQSVEITHNNFNKLVPCQIGRINYNNSTVKIYPHDLYPITTQLQIDTKIDEEVWTSPEYDCMRIWGKCFKNYEPQLTRGVWSREIVQNQYESLWGGLKLFGVTHNALLPVVRLVSLCSLNQQSSDRLDKVLFHAVTVICWQFYTMERDRWLQIQMIPHEEFHESDIPNFFMFFLRYDIKKDPYKLPTEEWKQALQSNDHLADFARKYDFVTFFHSVMMHLLPIINQKFFTSTTVIRQNKVIDFISGKLFNNFTQLLHTSKFWAPFVGKFDEECIKSVISACANDSNFKEGWMFMTLSKHFVSMKNNGWFKYDLGAKPQLNNTKQGPDQPNNGVSQAQMLQIRVPCPHTHFYFNAEQAIFVFDKQDTTGIDGLEEKCKQQDKILNQLEKCMDQKTINECRTALNQMYRFHQQQSNTIVDNNNNNTPTESKRLKKRKKSATNANTNQSQAAIEIENRQESAPQTPVLASVVAATATTKKKTKKKVQPEPTGKRARFVEKEPETEPSNPNTGSGFLREHYRDPIDINIIRARYSFYIDREANTVCVGTVPYLAWQDDWDIEPETSVRFIHPRVWNWLVQSGADYRVEELTKSNSSQKVVTVTKREQWSLLKQTDANVEVYQYYSDKQKCWLLTSINRDIVPISQYTMDYDAVRYYICYSFNRISVATQQEGINWYVLYYALIVLTRSESKAAATIVKNYYQYINKKQSSSSTTPPVSADILQDRDFCLRVLQIIQKDYVLLRSNIKTRMYANLNAEASIQILIQLAKRTWDRQNFNIISEETWKDTFNAAKLKSVIESHLVFDSIKMYNAQQEDVTLTEKGTLRLLYGAIIKHLAGVGENENGNGITIAFEYYNYCFSVPLTDEEGKNSWYSPLLSIAEFNDYLISLLEPLFIQLSYLFQHLFPGSVIVDPCSQQHEQLTQARNVAPNALALLYSVRKGVRNEKFVKEVEDLLIAKEEAERSGAVFRLPVLTLMMYNILLYEIDRMDKCLGNSEIYQTNMNNCSEKDRGIAQLEENLKKLCTDSTIYDQSQTQILERSINTIGNGLIFSINSFDETLTTVLHGLFPYFQPNTIPDVVYYILQQVMLRNSNNPIVQTKLQHFKQECLRLPESYHTSDQSLETLKQHLKPSLQSEYQRRQQQQFIRIQPTGTQPLQLL